MTNGLNETIARLGDELTDREFETVMNYIGNMSDAVINLIQQTNRETAVVLLSITREMMTSEIEAMTNGIRYADNTVTVTEIAVSESAG